MSSAAAVERADAAAWMGEIPEQWHVARLKYVARLGTGHTPSRQRPEYWEDCTIPWVTLADVWQLRDGRRTTITETAEKISELGLANSAAVLHPAATVILSRTASVGFSAILGVDAATSQDFMTWTCGPRLEPTYLLYVLRAMKQEFRRLVMGSTHKTIYMPDIERLTIPLPSVEEQQRVVAHVERELERLDRLVEKREKLLDLLAERERRLILLGVGGAFTTSERVKSSGLGWLPMIPVDWDVLPLRARYEVQLGKMLNPAAVAGTAPAPYLRNTNVQWDRLDLSDLAQMDFSAAERRKFALKPGDLLVCEGGEVGRAAQWAGELEECYYQKAIHRVRPRGTDHPRFLLYCLRAAAGLGVFAAEGKSTIPHLTAEKLRAHRFPFPPVDVQEALVQRLDEALQASSRLRHRVREQLQAIEEHRDTLIFGAVTRQLTE